MVKSENNRPNKGGASIPYNNVIQWQYLRDDSNR